MGVESNKKKQEKSRTVVAKSRKLDIEDAALVLPQTTHADSVAVAEIPIEPRLRTIVLVKHADGRVRGRGTCQRLRLSHVRPHGGLALLGRGSRASLEAEAHAGGVAVDDGNAIARRRDAQAALLDKGRLGVVEAAEDLAGLGLELVFLALDEGHHVVNHVHGRHAGVSRARDGLHGDDADGGDGAKRRLEGGQGPDEPDDGAVGVAHQEAPLELVHASLVGDEIQVREVDGRHDERHERIAPVVLGIREDGDFGLEKLLLCFILIFPHQQNVPLAVENDLVLN